MIAITVKNIEAELVAASMQQPVLLDIWAPWCAPCKALGPVLEKLENDYAGRFKLAKLNSDEQPQIASQLSQMFGVRSIPFCVLFSGGQPVDGFVGALPESQIRQFLDKHVPSESEMAAEAELLDAEAELAELAEGNEDAALAKLQQALAADPANNTARIDCVKLLLDMGRAAEAQQVFEPVASQASGDARLTALAQVLEAFAQAAQARPLDTLAAVIGTNKRDFPARHERAQVLLATGHRTEALDELLEILMRDKAWNEGLARKLYVAILELMSKPAPKAVAETQSTLEVTGKAAAAPSDPVIEQYRRKLSMVIF